MIINLEDNSTQQNYQTLCQLIIPRPIAWILTQNIGLESYNLAPYSWFNAISSNPPLVMISSGPKTTGGLKDSAYNLMTGSKTNQAVIHIPSLDLLDHMNQTSTELARNESELELTNLSLVHFDGFELPRIKQCSVAMGCSFHSHLDIGNQPQRLLFLEIHQIYLADDIINSSTSRLEVNTKSYDPVARLGPGEYANLGDIIRIKRPD